MSVHNLARYAAWLAKERDEYQALYAEYQLQQDLGTAKAYARSLDRLWFDTDGEFGQPLVEQPGGAS
jgi:RNAse (barnase) inhibitor barstar